jgi:hypothetical protein
MRRPTRLMSQQEVACKVLKATLEELEDVNLKNMIGLRSPIFSRMESFLRSLLPSLIQ